MGEFRRFVEDAAKTCQKCGRPVMQHDMWACSKCKLNCCIGCMSHGGGSRCRECQGIAEAEKWTPEAKARREAATKAYIASSRIS